MSQQNPPPGWHPDPEDNRQQRYWDGTQWTEHRAPAPPQTPVQQPPAQGAESKPWYLRWWAIAAAVIVVLIIIGSAVGGGGSSDSTAGSNDSGSASATDADDSTSGGSSDGDKQPSKKKDEGLDSTGGAENEIKAGTAFRLGDFRVMRGWRIENVGYGLGYTVENLRVRNITDSSHQFSVDIKLYRGKNNVSADISCIANEAQPDNVVEVDCFPDGSGKPYDRVTIGNSF